MNLCQKGPQMALPIEERRTRKLAAYYEKKARALAEPSLEQHLRELRRAKAARWRGRHPALSKEIAARFHTRHREEINEGRRAHRVANLDACLQEERTYLENNRERINERERQRYADDPTKGRAKCAKREALRRGAPINDFTAEDWEACKAQYKYRCVYCPTDCWWCQHQKHALEKDHLTPLSKGGSHTKNNIVPCCRKHNAEKKDRAVLIPVQPMLL